MEVAVVMEAAAGARWRTESPAVGGERARTRERTALRDAGPWQERNFEVRPLKVVTNFEVRPHLFYLAPL